MKEAKIKFYVERSSFWTQGALIFMGLAIIFRLIGCLGLLDDSFFLATQVLLPIVSGLVFIVLLAALGKAALWTTFLPVLGGVAFFVIKATGFENTVQMLLCLLLYAVVAIVYCGTVFTLIRTKWLLVPLFFLPLAYHLYEDVMRLRDTVNPVSFAAGMQEMSVLGIMLSLLFASLAMKKLTKEPKVKPWSKPAVTEEPAQEPVAQPESEPSFPTLSLDTAESTENE